MIRHTQSYCGTKFHTAKEYRRHLTRFTGIGCCSYTYEKGAYVYELSSNGKTMHTRDRGLAQWAIVHRGEVRVRYAPGGPVLPEYMAELFTPAGVAVRRRGERS